MARIFALDVLECPRCGGRMRIPAAIEDPSASRKILDYLGLPRLLPLAETDTSKSPNDGQAGCLRRRVPLTHPPLRSGAKISFLFLCAPKTPETPMRTGRWHP